MSGMLNPSTKTIQGTGTIRDECGPITMTGTFTSDSVSISGRYKYSEGGDMGHSLAVFNPKYRIPRADGRGEAWVPNRMS